MGAPMPASVCPYCQHSNPVDSWECERCHRPTSRHSDDLETQMIGEGWSVAVPEGEAVRGLSSLAPGQVLGDRYPPNLQARVGR